MEKLTVKLSRMVRKQGHDALGSVVGEVDIDQETALKIDHAFRVLTQDRELPYTCHIGFMFYGKGRGYDGDHLYSLQFDVFRDGIRVHGTEYFPGVLPWLGRRKLRLEGDVNPYQVRRILQAVAA